ncbi:hypothetical protein ETB97_008485 [Aspergillus alliaceus]|uniref:Uncharacterized protein n=1 Tax=Petromyces alliaceus TaxID=209559 RepID=A0A8H6AD41_PETAA|nr:hypothetical protein ETB97_008485 [Aspergillus burnettii]
MPLPIELTAPKAMLHKVHDQLRQPLSDHNVYTLGSIHGHNIVVACPPFGVFETVSAPNVVSHLVGLHFSQCAAWIDGLPEFPSTYVSRKPGLAKKKNQQFRQRISKTANRLRDVFPDADYDNRELWEQYLPPALSLIGEEECQLEEYPTLVENLTRLSNPVHTWEALGKTQDAPGFVRTWVEAHRRDPVLAGEAASQKLYAQ